MKMHFYGWNLELLLSGVVLFATMACKSPDLPLVKNRDLSDMRDLVRSLGLSTTVTPGSILAKNQNEHAFHRITQLSKLEQVRDAAKISGDPALVHRLISNTRMTETRHRWDIRQLLRSFGISDKTILNEIDRVVCEVSGAEILEIRDEAILYDVLNRPYTVTGEDDAIANAMRRSKNTVLLCSGAAISRDVIIICFFRSEPNSTVMNLFRDTFARYAAQEGLTFAANDFVYDAITKSVKARFQGQITLAARAYPLYNSARGVGLGQPIVICRSPFVLALFRWPS